MTVLGFLALRRPHPRIPRARRSPAASTDAIALTQLETGPLAARSKPSPRASSAASASRRPSCTIRPSSILDEPTDGLDPNQKHEVRTLIRRMAPQKAIVISPTSSRRSSAVCTRAMIIAGGRVVADDTPAALAARDPAGRLDEVFRAITLPASLPRAA